MFKAILIALAILILASCGNRERIKINGDGKMISDRRQVTQVGEGKVGDNISPDIVFADVLEVMKTNCTLCHAGYSNYANVKADLNSILQEVFSNSMPQFGPPLSDDEKMLLEDWAALGAPES